MDHEIRVDEWQTGGQHVRCGAGTAAFEENFKETNVSGADMRADNGRISSNPAPP